ncbi:MAG TPA: hypothetical protein VI076_15625 [Actinopolymorphaceae bacterium]
MVPLFATYFAVYLVSPLIRKRRGVGIGLSPDGIYHWSWLGCCFYSWDWIVDVRASGRLAPDIALIVSEPEHRPGNPEESWISNIGRFRERCRTINAGYLKANPVVAYAALKYYLDHPERRQELATDEGVRRIGQLDFPGM